MKKCMCESKEKQINASMDDKEEICEVCEELEENKEQEINS